MATCTQPPPTHTHKPQSGNPTANTQKRRTRLLTAARLKGGRPSPWEPKISEMHCGTSPIGSWLLVTCRAEKNSSGDEIKPRRTLFSDYCDVLLMLRLSLFRSRSRSCFIMTEQFMIFLSASFSAVYDAFSKIIFDVTFDVFLPAPWKQPIRGTLQVH